MRTIGELPRFGSEAGSVGSACRRVIDAENPAFTEAGDVLPASVGGGHNFFENQRASIPAAIDTRPAQPD